jgi:hypothetical protein
MLYVMMYGDYPPFKEARDIVLTDITLPARPAVPEAVKALIRSMVNRSVLKRISLEDVVRNPWVAQVKPKFLHPSMHAQLLHAHRTGNMLTCVWLKDTVKDP